MSIMHKGDHFAPYWLLACSEGENADYSLTTGFLATRTPQYKMLFYDRSLIDSASQGSVPED